MTRPTHHKRTRRKGITYVMIANVSWNMMKTDSGIVPFMAPGNMFLYSDMVLRSCVAVFHSQNFSDPPMKALPNLELNP